MLEHPGTACDFDLQVIRRCNTKAIIRKATAAILVQSIKVALLFVAAQNACTALSMHDAWVNITIAGLSR